LYFEYFKERDNSVITDLFTGQMYNKIKCDLCMTDSYYFYNFNDITCGVPHGENLDA